MEALIKFCTPFARRAGEADAADLNNSQDEKFFYERSAVFGPPICMKNRRKIGLIDNRFDLTVKSALLNWLSVRFQQVCNYFDRAPQVALGATLSVNLSHYEKSW